MYCYVSTYAFAQTCNLWLVGSRRLRNITVLSVLIVAAMYLYMYSDNDRAIYKLQYCGHVACGSWTMEAIFIIMMSLKNPGVFRAKSQVTNK